MIIGTGIDTVNIHRMEKWVNNPNLLRRYFDPREVEAVGERGKGLVSSIAARFAAKEAFGKALGTGLEKINLKDIMVLHNSKGKPQLHLTGSALEAMKAAGAQRVHISITHDGDMALASIILEA